MGKTSGLPSLPERVIAADREQAQRSLDEAEGELLRAAGAVDIDRILSMLSRFRLLFLGMEPAAQKELVRALVEKIVPQGDGWRVEFRAPFSDLLASSPTESAAGSASA
ncbi:MAG: hypothetical protein MUE60_14960 [Candidatus Eisenbacteria bacterium]|nr:hypothetical protein [Candidatus Eisenbacteria bacterium]